MSLRQMEDERSIKVEEQMRRALAGRLGGYFDEVTDIDVLESQSIASLAASTCLDTLRCGKGKDR